MEHILIQELMLYKFNLGYSATKATKNISCIKAEGTVDHGTVTKWFKKFHLGCKNLDNQARSDKSKTVNSEAVPRAMKVNPVSRTHRVSNLAYDSSVWFITFTMSAKASSMLVGWVLWHINLCRLFNTKSIFMQIVLFQTIQFSMST